jgi:hypothetical protein
MGAGGDTIKEVQHDVIESLVQTQTEVVTTQLQLNQYFVDLSRRDQAIDYQNCIQNKQRHLNSAKPESFFTAHDFDNCLSKFFEWATFDSLDSLSNGAEQYSLADGADLAKSNSLNGRLRDPIGHLQQIALLANELHNPDMLPQQPDPANQSRTIPDMTHMLPNPYDWANGARSYIQVLLDWRGSYGQPQETDTHAHITAMLATGEQIRAALQAAALDGASKPRLDFFQNLMSSYEMALLLTVNFPELIYRRNNNLPEDKSELDLFRGANQPVVMNEKTEKMIDCATTTVDTWTTFVPHSWIINGGQTNDCLDGLPVNLIPNPFKVAQKLGLGSLLGSYRIFQNSLSVTLWLQTDPKLAEPRLAGRTFFIIRDLMITLSGEQSNRFVRDNWTHGTMLRDQFESHSKHDPSTDCTDQLTKTKAQCNLERRTQAEADSADLQRMIQEALNKHRENINPAIADLERAVRNSDVGRTLLEAFVELALPNSLLNDHDLHELFRGNDSLESGSDIQATIKEQWVKNPHLDLGVLKSNTETDLNSKLKKLGEKLKAALQKPEENSLVSDTIQELKIVDYIRSQQRADQSSRPGNPLYRAFRVMGRVFAH